MTSVYLFISTSCPSFNPHKCCVKLTQALSLLCPISSTKHSVFVTDVSPGSICICSSSLLNQPRKPPEELPPSVNLQPSTEHSRGWTASGDFLPLPRHLETQTPRPKSKAEYHPLKTYETHHHLCHPFQLTFSSFSTLF